MNMIKKQRYDHDRMRCYSPIRKQYAKIIGFREIDFQFADFIFKLSSGDADLYQTALLLSYVTGLQHSALDLKQAAGQPIEAFLENEDFQDKPSGIVLPGFDKLTSLVGNVARTILGKPGEKKPLILDDDGLLYLYRYWDYERRVAQAVIKLLRGDSTKTLPVGLLKILFDDPPQSQGIDWQKVSAVAAFKSMFSVISGGPGTGKTTTVAKLLALLLEADPRLEIHLVAPTGKAADRLAKSVQKAKLNLAVTDQLKKLIPEKAATIHRYLDYLQTNGTFRNNRDNRTTSDLLVVDEASMVSLPLFAHLFEALPDTCRVILLGDKDQLASVETGCVFRDLSSADFINRFSVDFTKEYNGLSSVASGITPQQGRASLLCDRCIKLEHSYRFGNISGIGYLSFLVKEATTENDAKDIVAFLHDRKLNPSSREKIIEAGKPTPANKEFHDIGWAHLPAPDKLKSAIREVIVPEMAAYLEVVQQFEFGEAEPEKVLAQFDQFRVLCAVNRGVYGVENVNRLIEELLFSYSKDRFYSGRPIMVLNNDYTMQLFNGDIGIILKNSIGETKAYFLGENDTIRFFAPAFLPAHVTAFSMTVHKSQGCEFDNVLMILPNRSSKVLTKEIIYTGITRAKSSVRVWGIETILKTSLICSLRRTSGLKKQLLQQHLKA